MTTACIYVAVRRDLGMRRGKEIAQACHAVLGLGAADRGPIIGVRAESLAHLNDMLTEAKQQRIPTYTVSDAGHTENPPGTVTCAAIGPVEKGWLKLLSAAALY